MEQVVIQENQDILEVTEQTAHQDFQVIQVQEFLDFQVILEATAQTAHQALADSPEFLVILVQV